MERGSVEQKKVRIRKNSELKLIKEGSNVQNWK